MGVKKPIIMERPELLPFLNLKPSAPIEYYNDETAEEVILIFDGPSKINPEGLHYIEISILFFHSDEPDAYIYTISDGRNNSYSNTTSDGVKALQDIKEKLELWRNI